MDDPFAKWDSWLGAIHDEALALHRNRGIFWGVQGMIRLNPSLHRPSSFYGFLGSVYSQASVIAIRRQAEDNKQSISMARLLREMSEHPSFLTRARFRAMYPEKETVIVYEPNGAHAEEMDLGIADEDFNRFAAPGAETIDPGIVRKDRESLEQKAAICSDYADQRVAHYDTKPTAATPKFQDVNEAIDLLGEFVKKYFLLFRATGITSLDPVFQGDWRAIFREPWIKPAGSEVF
jgi:hypothetical protein